MPELLMSLLKNVFVSGTKKKKLAVALNHHGATTLPEKSGLPKFLVWKVQ